MEKRERQTDKERKEVEANNTRRLALRLKIIKRGIRSDKIAPRGRIDPEVR